MNFNQDPARSATSPNEFADYEETHVPYLPKPYESPQPPAWRTSPQPPAWRTSPVPAPNSQSALRRVLRSNWAVLGISIVIALVLLLIYFAALYIILIF